METRYRSRTTSFSMPLVTSGGLEEELYIPFRRTSLENVSERCIVKSCSPSRGSASFCLEYDKSSSSSSEDSRSSVSSAY